MSNKLDLEAVLNEEFDDVSAPEHYLAGKAIEPIDVIEDWALGAHTGTALKYIARWQRKGGVQSLKKAVWYLNRKIERIEDGTDNGHA